MPEYDPDYVQLANGKVIRIDRSSYLVSGPAVTGKTIEDVHKYISEVETVVFNKPPVIDKEPVPKIPWYIRIQMRLKGIR